MPPKPPLDISTTTSPSRCSATIVETMSSISGMWRACRPPARQIVDELLGRQPLGLRQRRAKHRRDDHLVGCAERFREVVLEHTAAGRGRPRLEHRPDPPAGIARAQRRQRFVHRRRMMREVVQHGDPRSHANRLEPALDALELPQPVGQRLRRQADVAADRDRRQRIAHVVHAKQRRLESPERLARRGARRSASRRRDARRRRPATSRPAVEAERLDRADRHRRQRMRMRAVGAEQQQAVARHQLHQAAERDAARRRDPRRCRRDRTRCC